VSTAAPQTGRIPPVLALTGTASQAVLHDVHATTIDDFEAIITPKSFDRPELHFGVFQSRSSEKWEHAPRLAKALTWASYSPTGEGKREMKHRQTEVSALQASGACPFSEDGFGIHPE